MRLLAVLYLVLIHTSLYAVIDFSGLVEKVSPGVVNIQATKIVRTYGYSDFAEMFMGLPPSMKEKSQSSLGSGFIAFEKNYVITNSHVIDNTDEVLVILTGKDEKYMATVVGSDRRTDIAVLRIPDIKGIEPLELGDSDILKVGEPAFAIGNPFGLSHSVTAGIISAKDRTFGLGKYDHFLQTDASINFGNSGGPLFGKDGKVIGINTAIHPTGRGIGYAIPINTAKKIVPQLIQYGEIRRSWIGVIGVNMTRALAWQYNIKKDSGVLITSVIGRTPAHVSGLQAGDVILEIDGEKIQEIYKLQSIFEDASIGKQIKISILRRGRIKEIMVTTQKMPNEKELPEGYNFL